MSLCSIMKEESANQGLSISEAFLPVFLTFVSYAAAYAYRLGYAGYFGIPPGLLSPSFALIFKFLFRMGSTLYIAYMLLNCFWALLPQRETILWSRLRLYVHSLFGLFPILIVGKMSLTMA